MTQAAGSVVLDGVKAILDWIFGGLRDTITPFVMRFLTRVDLVFGGGLERMVVPLVVIGAALMVLGAVASVIQGYGAVIAGAASSASVISGVLMRVAGLALLMGSWHTLVPIGVDVANAFSGYVLSDQAINDALAKTFGLTAAGGASAGIAAASGVAPIVLVILLVLLAMFFVALLLLKYVVTFAFAVLYLGGPVMLGLGAFPGLGSVALNSLVRSLAILILIPLSWATVFAAWAAVNSTLVTAPPKTAGAFALAVINGPGIFVASCLVVFGVTRALIKMATPLGAPLSIPGARLAMAAAAYKAAPALWSKLGAASEGLPGAEAVAEHNSRYEGTPYRRAVAASEAWDGPGVSDGMNLAVAGGGAGSDLDVGGGARRTGAAAGSGPASAGGSATTGDDVIDGTAHEIAPERPRARASLRRCPPAPRTSMLRERGSPSRARSLPSRSRRRWGNSTTGRSRTCATRRRAPARCSRPRAATRGTCTSASGWPPASRTEPPSVPTAIHTRRRSAPARIRSFSTPSIRLRIPSAHPAHQEKMYTERELRRDWTRARSGR